MDNNKAIGAVIAVALLLVVAIVGVVTFQGWFTTYFSGLQNQIEEQEKGSLDTGIERVIGNTLYFKVTRDDFDIKKVEVNGKNCNITGEFQKGIEKFDITQCLNESAPVSSSVVVYTNSNVYSEFFTVEEVPIIIPEEGNNGVFSTVWNTSADGDSSTTQIRLPLKDSGTYNFTVFWGDGTNDTITSWNQAEKTHTYGSAGVYEVNMTGTIDGFAFGEGNSGYPDYIYYDDAPKLLDVQQWGDVKILDGGAQFHYAENLQISATDAPDLSGVTNMSEMFSRAYVLNSNIDHWDVSSATEMRRMFFSTYAFNQPLDSWDVSSVTTMKRMFDDAENFNQSLNSWDVSSVTNMDYMLSRLDSFNQPLDNWDVSSVTSMVALFRVAFNFNQPIDTWNVSSVTNMSYSFDAASSFNQSLNSWDVSSVIDMEGMFHNTYAFNQPLNNWNVSSVVDMGDSSFFYEGMFESAQVYNQDLTSWNVDNVVDCGGFNASTLPEWTQEPNFTNCTP